MKKKNGFTLVELLAVIVVLAIIMIIAIPSVLDVMNSARKSSFVLYCEKVVTAVQTQFTYDNSLGNLHGAGLYVYDIGTDLSLTSTGSYVGYVVVDNRNTVNPPHFILYMHDNNYEIYNWDVTAWKMPEAGDVKSLNNASAIEKMPTIKTACDHWAMNKGTILELDTAQDDSLKGANKLYGPNTCQEAGKLESDTCITCFNREGFIIENGTVADTGSNPSPTADAPSPTAEG